MVERFWDPQGKYTHGFLREYQNWVLEVSYRQHTLGCYIIFGKGCVSGFAQMTSSVAVELTRVMRGMERALEIDNNFGPAMFNYLQIGDKSGHLQIHGIPRYHLPREFAGRVWKDSAWGEQPLWAYDDSSHDLVALIRDELKGPLTEVSSDHSPCKGSILRLVSRRYRR